MARPLSKRRTKVTGIEKTISEVNKKLREYGGNAEAGAYTGAMLIEKAAKMNTPREFGNLRASSYVQKIDRGVEVGFSAVYAAAVHENLEMKWAGKPRPPKKAPKGKGKGKPKEKATKKRKASQKERQFKGGGIGVYWGPDGEAQFLSKALIRNQGVILQAMKDSAQGGLKG